MRRLIALSLCTLVTVGCDSPTEVGPPAFFRYVSGSDQQGAVNAMLPEPFVFEVLDARLRPVPDVHITWTVAYYGPPDYVYGAELLDPDTTITARNGRVSVRARVGPRVGGYKYFPLALIGDEWSVWMNRQVNRRGLFSWSKVSIHDEPVAC